MTTASQGAGRLLWPLLANFSRLVIAAGVGYVALAVALCAFGLINAAAVAGGSWFDRPLRVAREELA